MDVHWGLEEEEVKQGYILTCQSHPLTKKIVIDFQLFLNDFLIGLIVLPKDGMKGKR